MNGHLKWVSIAVMAVWLAIPCHVQSGHFDVLRNSSPNFGNQGVTITIRVPEGIIPDLAIGGAIKPDEMTISRQPQPALYEPHANGSVPSRARAFSVTVSFLVDTGKTGGSLSIPIRDARQQDVELTLAISSMQGDSLTSPPVNGRCDYISHGLPEKSLFRSGPSMRPETRPRSDGPNSGQIELTVLKSYPNTDTFSGPRLLDRGPKNPRKRSMKIFSDINLGS